MTELPEVSERDAALREVLETNRYIEADGEEYAPAHLPHVAGIHDDDDEDEDAEA